MLGGGTGGGLFGTPQSGLGRGTGLGGGLNTGGGGLFNRPSGGLFGNTGTATGSLGGTTGTGLFGQTPASTQSGGGLFGNTGLGGGGGGLFQTPSTGLGGQAKTTGLFGQSPMLGAANNPSLGGGGGLFGQTTSAGLTAGGGLFGTKPQTTGTGILGGGLALGQSGGLQSVGGLGGGLGQATGGIFGGGGTVGTTVKYEPLKATDTLNKNGVSVNVNTLLHCITASSTYMQKSMEELRFEDYSAGRKGSANAGIFASGGLGGAGTGLFNQSKGLGVGTGGGAILGGLGTQNQLGAATSTGGGLFGNKLGGTGGGGLFGNTAGTQNKLGGGGGLFTGQQTSQAGGGIFGGASTSGGIFNQPGVGTQLGGGLGGQNQLGGGTLFNRTGGTGLGGIQGGGGLGLGGGLGTTGGLGTLGSTAGGLGLGGQTSQAGGLNMFNKPAGTGFNTGLGMGTQLGGGLGTGLGGGGTGGLNLGAGLNTGLGASKLGGGNLLGLGGANQAAGGLGQNVSLGQSALQQQQQEAQLKQQLEILANSPFGDSSLFRTAVFDASKQQKNKDPPTPIVHKPSPNTLQYKLNMRPTAKVKTISLSSPARHKEKNRLFEGLEDSPHSTANSSFGSSGTTETFVPRKSVKKLNIKPKPSQPHAWPDSTTPPMPMPSLPSPITSAPPTSTSTPAVSSLPSTGEDRATPTPVGIEPAEYETPEITLGTNALKKTGIRSLTNAASPIGASPALVQERKTSNKKVTVLEPVEEEDAAHRSQSASQLQSQLNNSAPSLGGRPRPCRVVLTDPSYYTKPSLDECDQMAQGNTCNVDNFTIGRHDCGEILFPGVTNIFGLNLDKIVTIEAREVVVYPDDLPDPKPPVGEGLNRQAVISMVGFWPKDKTTGDLIQDRQRLESMNYVSRLQRIVAKTEGGVFVDYMPESGTCIFKVEHFSKYKLDADDSEDEGEGKPEGGVKRLKTVQGKKQLPLEQTLDKAPPMTVPQPALLSQTTPTNGVVAAEEDDDMMGSTLGSLEEDNMVLEPGGMSLLPAQELVGSGTHRVQIMKASFFSTKDELNQTYSLGTPRLQPLVSRPGSRLDESLVVRPSSRASAHPSPFSRSLLQHTPFQTSTAAPSPSQPQGLTHEQALPTTEPLDPFTKFHRSHRPVIPPQAPTTPLQAQSAVLMAKRNLNVLLPATDKKERVLCDLGLFLGRSFRVGWGPNWTLAHSGVVIASTPEPASRRGWNHGGIFSGAVSRQSEKGHPIRVVVEQVSVNQSPRVCDSFEPFLATQLQNTRFTDRANPAFPPLCTPTSGTVLLNAFADVARANPVLVSLTTAKDQEAATQKQLRQVLDLMVVLWGDLSPECSTRKEMYENQQVRKQRLSQWLQHTNSTIIEEEMAAAASDVEDGYLKSLFSLVTGQQLGAACRRAQLNKDHKLVLLLSQAAYSTSSNRAFLRHQLDCWDRQKVLGYIHPVRLKLYVLLSGLMTWSKHSTHVNTSQGLDWRRSFALHLSYSCKLSTPIPGVLKAYEDGFQGDNAYAPPPYPPYIEAGSAPAMASLPYDTCYHLLQLYCRHEHSLELVAQPSTSTPHQLDYRISWMVWSVLSSLGYTHMHPTIMCQLLTSFASQLERSGKWEWSVFVLLHLNDPVLSRSAIQDTLSRNCSSGEELNPLEGFVVDKLKVPKQWVFLSKAQRASYEEWYDLKALHLLSAGEWNSAHETIMEHLAVDSIINDDTEDLLQMLECLSPSDRSGVVQGWECGGSVFLDYLRISKKFQELSVAKHEPSRFDLESLHVGLKQLAIRVGQLPSDSPRKVLCQSEIAQRTAEFTRVILQLKAKSAGTKNPQTMVAQEMVSCLQLLPIPPDYAITEYRALLQIHADNLPAPQTTSAM